jgi:5-methylthioribose kinase
MSEVFSQQTIEKLLGSGKFTVELLSGGVSCDTAKVLGNNVRAVIKRALPQLRVPGKWEADTNRILAEADAIELFSALTPAHVPALLARSDEDLAIAIALAAEDMRDWRYAMLEGIVEPEVGTILGKVLATWHQQTRDVELPQRIIDGKKRLFDLRAGAFYGGMARTWPEFNPLIRELSEELMDSRECVVHGDFSPKNILHGPSGTWVLDFEVSHQGAPVFDLGYMCAHLNLKAIKLNAERELVRKTLEDFLRSYQEHGGVIPSNIGAHAGVITGVRVAGISQVNYLDEQEKLLAVARARDLLGGARVFIP